MSNPTSPLFFPEALATPGSWQELGRIHSLSTRDFEWFSHLSLATQTLRSRQTPPMLAEKIMLGVEGGSVVPMAGSFILSATPDEEASILYTPYGGIKKYDTQAELLEALDSMLASDAQRVELLAFMSMDQRRLLGSSTSISVSRQDIEGDVFEDQSSTIKQNRRLNAQAMLDELEQLPTLTVLLDQVLNELLHVQFPGLDQRLTQVNVYTTSSDTVAGQQTQQSQRWIDSMSLGQAVVWYYRHQAWPSGQIREFFHPRKTKSIADWPHWEAAIKKAAGRLITLLSRRLEAYWSAPAINGQSRLEFFSQATSDRIRADILLKREASVISPEQSKAMHELFEQSAPSLTVETIRLWEYAANYVELAGSMIISHDNAFLYTPAWGFQVLKDYQDLLGNFDATDHEDVIYDLLNLEERKRFIGFDKPNVSGHRITDAVPGALFQAIITKQLQNMEYALQVFRLGDGEVDIHAMFDKALDVRSMIDEQMLELDSNGRWSTRPVFSGEQQPSLILADTAASMAKTFISVQMPIKQEFIKQPTAEPESQRVFLEALKPRLAHALSVGVRGEARLRVLNGTLKATEQAIIDAVLNPDKPTRKVRSAVNGFRPDAYSLTLERSGHGQLLPLANCLLVTERGGLDTQHSGRAILWTPATGLEVFATVHGAKIELDRRLLDRHERLALLENLTPAQHAHHQRYRLGALRLIESNVLHNRLQSAIDHLLGVCEHVRSLKLDSTTQAKALASLTQTVNGTNLQRAGFIAQAIANQHSLPAWLGMASVPDQQQHVELLEQYRNSVTDDQDYLHEVKPLASYVRETLESLLRARFPNQLNNPDLIEITPNLALAGPVATLTEFALNHINIAQDTGFKITSKTTQALPPGLDQSEVRKLLLSLNIKQAYRGLVSQALSGTGPNVEARKLRFARQLPWQLLQHAHAMKLQERLSDNAYGLIRQVLDMPDAIARAAVQGANAIVRPLELIKTTGAAAVKCLGLYLISAGQVGPQILYAPYHADEVFTEFEDEAGIVSAINTPGALQDLITRRLPEAEQALFTSLFRSTRGQESEITLASSPMGGNLLAQLFIDNTRLLAQMLGSQSEVHAQADWETAKKLFSAGIKVIAGLLPGKLAYGQFLWQSYKHFKASAQALQDHHWTQALQTFIAGAAQMISLGKMTLEQSASSPQTPPDTAPVTMSMTAPRLSQVNPTAPGRTALQRFEETIVALKDLKKDHTDGTFSGEARLRKYASIAGKVYRVAKMGMVLRMVNDHEEGPVVLKNSDQQLIIDPDAHTAHFGKAMSKMTNRLSTYAQTRSWLNIEAEGMDEIRVKYPEKARIILQALDLARFYAFNSLHNVALFRSANTGTRLHTFIKGFFDLKQIDDDVIKKIKDAIVPVCKALVDPTLDMLDHKRFVVGSNKYQFSDVIAFVLDSDQQKKVHFTEKFFDQGLDWYKSCLTEPFDVDGHAQASTLIHEFSHLFSKTVDIASLEARRPFTDLVTPITGYGAAIKQNQQDFQREALSLATPREELFARWNSELSSWISLDSIPGTNLVGKEILKITGSRTMEEARSAFLDQNKPDLRIDTILRNADSIAFLICEMGRQLDPVPGPSTSKT